ncbi:glycoside hydrolase family 127 protein [soil metagenome]
MIKNSIFFLFSIPLILGCTSTQREIFEDTDKGYQLTAVPFNEVILNDQFWKPRLQTQLETLVPFALDKTIPAVENLQKTAKFLKGEETDLPFPHRYIASDLFKVMEGAAYLLKDNRHPDLEERIDKIIDIIAEAQQEDGYLYEAHITGISKDHDHWGGGGMGDKPYSWVVHSHELYNMGHMYEAAIAYYQATGKEKWLKIAKKNALHLNKVFFEGDSNYHNGQPVNQAPGHQELELALAKLYRVTGNKIFLNMAKKFLDIRGITYVPEGEGVMAPTYAQQHKPVAEQREAVGHAVRAAYMYSGMAEVGALTNSDEYNEALKAIWSDIVDTKMHITGGMGAIKGIEGFGPAYELPNKEAYNETCAAVGNVFFNFRMFLLTREAKYMDVAEIALLNNSLAGVNMKGNEFFYVNPLEADGTTPFNHGKAGRSPWFSTACCPSNIARLIPQISGMMYSFSDYEIYTTYYAASKTTISLKDVQVNIEQETKYPFDEMIFLTINPDQEAAFDLKLRIPEWVQRQFVPGALYQYVDELPEEKWWVKVNNTLVDIQMENGFAVLNRKWKSGDLVQLFLPMPVRFNNTIPQVEANRSRMAITRGPLVYCAEGIDNEGPVQEIIFDQVPDQKNIQIKSFKEGILNQVVSIEVPAKRNSGGGTSETKAKLIPYFAWNNRGESSMIVWFPTAME